MRHEITGYTVVGVVKKNFHRIFSDSTKHSCAACFTAMEKSATPQRRLLLCA
jgi:hypothetical protein